MNRKTINLIVAVLSLIVASVIYLKVGAQFTEQDQRNVRLEELLRVEIYRRGLHSDAFANPNLRPSKT